MGSVAGRHDGVGADAGDDPGRPDARHAGAAVDVDFDDPGIAGLPPVGELQVEGLGQGHGRAGGQDHLLALKLRPLLGLDGETAVDGRNLRHLGDLPLGPQALSLLAACLHEVRPRDAFWKPVVVFDPGPAGLALAVVQHQRFQPRLGEKDGRAAAGNAAADYDDVVHEPITSLQSLPVLGEIFNWTSEAAFTRGAYGSVRNMTAPERE